MTEGNTQEELSSFMKICEPVGVMKLIFLHNASGYIVSTIKFPIEENVHEVYCWFTFWKALFANDAHLLSCFGDALMCFCRLTVW